MNIRNLFEFIDQVFVVGFVIDWCTVNNISFQSLLILKAVKNIIFIYKNIKHMYSRTLLTRTVSLQSGNFRANGYRFRVNRYRSAARNGDQD